MGRCEVKWVQESVRADSAHWKTKSAAKLIGLRPWCEEKVMVSELAETQLIKLDVAVNQLLYQPVS